MNIGSAIEMIKDFDIWHLGDLIDAIQETIKGVQELVQLIETCAKSYPELEEFFNKIMNLDIDIKVFAKNLILHGGELFPQ